MKQCFKCLEHKPIDDFYKHSAMGDGRLGKCKECTKADVKKHRADNLEKVRAYDRSRNGLPHREAARAEYRKTPAYAEVHAEACKRYDANNPEKKRAQGMVHKAVVSGRLIRWPVCAVPECTRENPQAHHPDYSRPLDVVWLCPKHHKAAHAIADEAKRNVNP